MVKKTRAYGIQRPLEDVFPVPVIALRTPTTSDTNYELGQLWVYKTTGAIYGLANVSSGSATWSLLGPGASDVDTLTGDSGGALSPTGGNITLAGGTNITTAGAGSTITFNLDAAITLATSVTSALYTTAAATDLLITAATGQDIVLKMGDAAGANKVSFTDSADAEVFAVDSNGAITFTNFVNSGTFTTSGGTASINASSNFNTVINSGTSTGTVTIGNTASGAVILNSGSTITIGDASAGAIAVDTAAGISLDSATASNFTVTGAADLTLSSSAGSLNLTAGEAVADAIVLNASDAGGGIQLQAGTGGILIGNQADCTTIDVGDIAPTASRTTTIGGGTVVTASVTDTIDIGPDGATTNADSVKTVNVNTGGVTTGQVLTNIATGAVTSGTHTVLIQSGNVAAGTVTTGISTGTGTKTVGLGNGDGNTTFNVSAITNINSSVNANTTINTGTSTGTVSIGNGAAGAITLDSGAGISLDAAAASNFTTSGAGIDIDIASGGGRVIVTAGEDAADAIYLHADAGISETIRLHADQGTGAASVHLESDVGGITLTSGLASADAINLAAASGGIDMDGALQINIASSQSAADAVRLVASDAAGGITLECGTGNVNVTGGNLVLSDVATQLEMNGGAVTDFIGTGTLTNGQVTIANTNIAANDRIFIQRLDENSSTTLGFLQYSISAGASFTVESKQTATPGSDETGDQSTFVYFIVRQN